MKTVVKKVIVEAQLNETEYLSLKTEEQLIKAIIESESEPEFIPKSSKRRNMKWNKKEITYLKDNRDSSSNPTMAKHLRRSTSAVASMIFALKQPDNYRNRRSSKSITKTIKRNDRNYTSSELNFIKKNINIMTYPEMAKNLKRSILGVSFKARQLGLSKR